MYKRQIFLNGTVFVRRLEQKIIVNLELSKLQYYQFPEEETPENVEIKIWNYIQKILIFQNHHVYVE